MNNIKLSFCIPTYNRRDLLSELIESIVSQCDNRDDVEICISDNASDDGTDIMVSSWGSKTNIPIVYRKNEENLGPDINIIASPSFASGTYCWLVGSDDKLFDDAIEYIDKYLDESNDIYLVERTEFDYDMIEIKRADRRWMCTEERSYDLADERQLLNYFSNSLSIGAIFSFMSSIIVKRSRWNEVIFDTKYIGCAYTHVYYILSIIKKGATIQYINKPCIMCRGGNDSFVGSVVSRIELDFNGYTRLADGFYADNNELKSRFLNVLLHERPFLFNSMIVSLYGTAEEKNRMKDYYLMLGQSEIIINIIYRVKPILKLVKYLKDKIKNLKK
ncbi:MULTISPECIES: glycosyltransferase family 2 protein [Yersinia]|uniref:glycosyltransferase family 2 protein n=1 Tax=Yersinia TaxID=629 RepID=UPI0005E3994F|nr:MULTISPECIES: glycosyltransferase family 2 protein [Yersinia]ARB86060.1 glycosyltransferase family 2 protein [Yersinia sp. FDAARGOS_228]AVL35909.1 glycosyltransferase family 2 protein [Yersinia intermedia]CND67050.1 putative glycosyltransferase [Yersinia intermedia]